MKKAVHVLEDHYPGLPRFCVKQSRAWAKGRWINLGEDIFGQFDIYQLLPGAVSCLIQVKAYDSSNCARARREIGERVTRPLTLDADEQQRLQMKEHLLMEVWGFVKAYQHFKVWRYMWNQRKWYVYEQPYTRFKAQVEGEITLPRIHGAFSEFKPINPRKPKPKVRKPFTRREGPAPPPRGPYKKRKPKD